MIVEGPRFSTRAESQWSAAQGWTLVGMTVHPEAVLARELALCYTPLALVTDTDAGAVEGEGVTHAEVLEVFGANVTRLRRLVEQIIEGLPAERDCPARMPWTGSSSRSSFPASGLPAFEESLLTYCGPLDTSRITGNGR